MGIGSDLEWTDFCLTLNDTLVQFFIDGDLVNAVSCDAFASIDANMGLATHWWPDGQSSRFVADYQHLLVWDRGLTSTEFEDFYSHAKGCTDPAACNYNAQKILHDGSCGPCEVLQSACLDGTVWDADLAGCVPVLSPISACGEGTVWSEEFQECVIVNPSDTDFDGCVGMTDLLDLLSVFGTCNETPWSCGDPLEYQGYDYQTVQIGEQCWFAENARHLPFVSPSNLGWEDDGGAHAYVVGYEGTSVEEAKMEGDYAAFGALYNFAAVEELVMCPQGWHVPSVIEWNVLEAFAGPAPANKLKSAPPVWDGTNELGFNAIRVPVRISSGSFGAFNVKADFWTSTPSETSENNAWGRELNTGQEEFTHDENGKNAGQPVRCIQDSE